MKLTIEDKIKKINLKGKIKIRLNKLKDGRKRIYLHLQKNYKDSFMWLDLFITTDQVKNEQVLKVAEEIRDIKEFEMNRLELDHIPIAKKEEIVSFKNFYLDEIRNKQGKNLIAYKTALNSFIKFLKNDMNIIEIKERHIEDYVKSISHLSTHSQSDYVSCIRRIFNKAVDKEIITRNPVKVKIIKAEVDIKYISDKEVMQIYNVEGDIDYNVRNAFVFSCFTGLRISDIYKLTWEDVKDNYLKLRQTKTKGIIRNQLPETAQEILSMQSKDTELVFNLPGYKKFRRLLKELIEKSGIDKHITFHFARHTCGTMCIDYDVDIYTVKDILGHTDVRTTQKYAKLRDKKKQREISKLPVLNKKKKD